MRRQRRESQHARTSPVHAQAPTLESIRYTERLAVIGDVASASSSGGGYDNALAESIIGLYKTELVRNCGPRRGLDDLELATLEWVDWCNQLRIQHRNPGRVPSAEAEHLHDRREHSTRQSETHNKQPA